MARQKPPSKAGAFWRAINVREDLAHGSAQGFVLERSEELCPLAGQASLWRAEKETVQQKVFSADPAEVDTILQRQKY